MKQIFVSYSRESTIVAASVVNDLEGLGNTVWMDKHLTGGQVWWDEILAEIRRCDVFVFVLDRHWMASTACEREFQYARDTGATLLPLIASDEISVTLLPAELQALQFVSYTDPTARETLYDVGKALSGMPARPTLPDPLPDPPPVPISYIAELAARVRSKERLTGTEQKSLLFDLKAAVEDRSNKQDALSLLRELSARGDLLASVANEIKATLAQDEPVNRRRTSGPPHRQPKPEPQQQVNTPSTPIRAKLAAVTHEPGLRALISVPLGAVLGVAIAITLYLVDNRTILFSGIALFTAIYAVTGVFIALAFNFIRRRPTLFVVGLVVAVVAAHLITDDPYDGWVAAMMFGIPLASVVSAMLSGR